MLHVEVAYAGTGILNLEWAVLPPGIMVAAIPDVAVAIAIRLSLCNLANIAL